MASRDKALLCAREAFECKALDLVLLDVTGLTSFTDYFVICSGKSSRQVQGVANNLERGLAGAGVKPLGVEGRVEGHWVLMDYGDVVIHIFYEPVRYFYDLESLWSDAKRVNWSGNAAALEQEIDRGAL
jgi:ribosome-associated protein